MTSSSIIIETPHGPIRGNQSTNGHNEFLGIRYATAQRFHSPIDVQPWSEVLDATQHGSICPQVPGVLEMMLGFDESTMNEDCLFLNVFTPNGAGAESKLPVLFLPNLWS